MEFFAAPVFSSIFLGVLSVILVVTGFKNRPGIGIVFAVVAIALLMLVRGNKIADIGLQKPTSWSGTILLGLGWGSIIFLVFTILIDPLLEVITRTTFDFGPVARIKGNWPALLQILVFVWLFVAIVEEIIFRGFFYYEISKLIGSSNLTSLILNVVATSVIFGLCHAYQNVCGVFSTALTGAAFAVVFLLSGQNLWVAIFAHGFLDTLAIASIFFGFDERLKHIVWR